MVSRWSLSVSLGIVDEGRGWAEGDEERGGGLLRPWVLLKMSLLWSRFKPCVFPFSFNTPPPPTYTHQDHNSEIKSSASDAPKHKVVVFFFFKEEASGYHKNKSSLLNLFFLTHKCILSVSFSYEPPTSFRGKCACENVNTSAPLRNHDRARVRVWLGGYSLRGSRGPSTVTLMARW